MVLDEARPLISSLADGLPRVRRDAREARKLVRSATPFVDDAGRALMTVDGALPRLVELATQAAPAIDALVPALEALEPVLDDAGRLLDETADRGLLRRASGAITTLGRLAALQRSAVQTSRQSLAIQRETLTELKRSVEIQRELLVRVRSLDDKTLGTAPSATGPTP